MQQPGQPDINLTIAAWADVVLNIWRNKLTELKLWDTGELYRSLRYELYRNAGNNIEKIEFVYNYYGRFTDAGTVFIQTPKAWKGGPLFYAQVMKLKEILGEKYATIAITEITTSLMRDKT